MTAVVAMSQAERQIKSSEGRAGVGPELEYIVQLRDRQALKSIHFHKSERKQAAVQVGASES